MTAPRGRLAVPELDWDEILHCLDGGRPARALAAMYGMSVASLAHKAARAGEADLADRIRKQQPTETGERI